MCTENNRKLLWLLFWIVAANYIAQIPYYLHQYYSPHHLFPDVIGSILLISTLLWFIMAFRLLYRSSKLGWWLMFTYLMVVFLFYIQTQIMQFVTTHQILLHVYRPTNSLLFVVFGIGYINCLVAFLYLIYLVNKRKSLLNIQSV